MSDSGKRPTVLVPSDLDRLPKEFLLQLLRLYARCFLSVDGFWYLAVRERLGDEEALACDIAAWEKQAKYEAKRLAALAGIEKADLHSLMQVLRLTPWLQNLEYRIEQTGQHSFTLTVTRCPTLRALEAEGQGREASICNIVEPHVLKKYAEFAGPGIEVRPLRVPPRVWQDEVCCQWEFVRHESCRQR